MANDTLEEILKVEAGEGPFSTGDAVLEQTLRDFIQLQSTYNSSRNKGCRSSLRSLDGFQMVHRS